MVPERVMSATERRFDSRATQRADIDQKLKSGNRMSADTPERVQKRLTRLSMHAAAAAVGIPAVEVLETPAFSPLERILGTNDLMSITFLERAVRAARTVGRVRIRGAGGQLVGYGTGSLVSSRLLLTNNHVLGSPSEAAASQVEMNFQDALDGGTATPVLFALRPQEFFLTDPELDYTLVAAAETSADGGHRITDFGFNSMIEEEGKVIIGEYLNIVQHPNGEPKQVAVRENQLIDILDLFLHYRTDTAPGSSGSPVFNDQWEVVALHHSGVPRRDSQGRLLTMDGKLWTPAMGEHRLAWIANEGARISRVVKHVKDRTLTGTAAKLRKDLFEAAPASATAMPRPDPHRGVTIAPDGTISWTLPLPALQISFRMGDVLPPGRAAEPAAPPPAPPPEEPRELRDALAELEAAKKRRYYSKTKDEKARDAYYASISDSLTGTALFEALSTLLTETHAQELAYAPSKHVYPWVDLHEDRQIRSIYSGKTFDAEELIREDFRIDQERQSRLQEMLRAQEGAFTAERLQEQIDWLEANLPYNCEHVVPQSWFEKDEPMRGDLHHLFACEVGCNSFRGNKPYFDFADFEEAIRDECGKSEGKDKFEPGSAPAKGAVARATLYFLLRYPGQVNAVLPGYSPSRLATLLQWHNENPPTVYEKHRNAAIHEKQGNRNPLIDYPDWAEDIDFTAGL